MAAASRLAGPLAWCLLLALSLLGVTAQAKQPRRKAQPTRKAQAPCEAQPKQKQAQPRRKARPKKAQPKQKQAQPRRKTQPAQPRPRRKAQPKQPQPKQPRKAQPPAHKEIDRVVVRWHARAAGGVAAPHFITARELAFEARIEALTRGEAERTRYGNKHVQQALERHVAEVILASLPIDKSPTPKQVATQAENARLIIEQQVGGRAALNKAASEEGISAEELNALLRRRARAGWYLDRMVAPMLAPSELQLRVAHKRRQTPFSNRPFREVLESLKRWYVSRELDAALTRYFRNIRSRVTITVIRR